MTRVIALDLVRLTTVNTQKTILVVEDEKSLRDAIVDVLGRRGFVVIEAKNGKEGVALALAEHPDLILLDLIMPEMDGRTALKKIRADAWGRTVPIIILTNLSPTKEQLMEDMVTNTLLQYIIKSDRKIHDVVQEIEKILDLNPAAQPSV